MTALAAALILAPQTLEIPPQEFLWAMLEPQARNPNRMFQLRELQRVNIKFGKKVIPSWVMDTEMKRQEGMMYLTESEVKENEGMIFVFKRAQPLSFWMRNTILPLDLMYLDAKGRVLNVAMGRPFDESPIPSAGPAQYVLEMRFGSARRLGIRSGSLLTIPPSVKAKE